MNKFFPLIVSCLFLGWVIQMSSCAVIVPPGGGPRDSIAPVLVKALPTDSTLNFKAKTVVLTFDEYVQVQDIFNALIISPIPKSVPNVNGKLRTVTIKIKDTLEPNTTYSYNFGNAIQDVNENNPVRNFTYVFSTGDHLDTDSITGNVTLAENGSVDSTMMVVLYRNLADTAVLKTAPRYYTRIDSSGHFAFHFLPKENYHIFAVENSYMKNYGDSTSLFAFYDSIVSTKRDSVNNGLKLFAYREFAKEEKARKPAVLSEKQIAKRKEEEAKKPLNVNLNLQEGKQGLLLPLVLSYSKPLKTFIPGDVKITDTNHIVINDYKILPDTSDSTNASFIVQKDWSQEQGKDFEMILPKEAATDSFNVQLAKPDTVRFQVKSEQDYAALQLNFPDVEMARKPVLLIMSSELIVDSVALDSMKQVKISRFEPGEYGLRILYDTNGDLKWTPGSYSLKRQPEIVVPIKKKFKFIADTDNQWDIYLKKNSEEEKQENNPYKLNP